MLVQKETPVSRKIDQSTDVASRTPNQLVSFPNVNAFALVHFGKMVEVFFLGEQLNDYARFFMKCKATMAAFSVDGTRLVVATSSGRLRVLDIDFARIDPSNAEPEAITLASWYPYEDGGITAIFMFMAGRVVTACDRELNVWSTRTTSCTQRIRFPISVTSDSSRMDPSGRFLVVSDASIDLVYVLEVKSSSFRRVYKYSGVLYPISLITRVKLAVNPSPLGDVTNRRCSVSVYSY